MQNTMANRPFILKWLGRENYVEKAWDPVNIRLLNRHGEVIVEKNDWVVKGSDGEFYPCPNAVFQDKYEKVP